MKTGKNILMGIALTSALFVSAQEPVDYVNPFVGTTNYGTTNPGAVVPQGMMSATPFNVMGSEDNKYDKDKQWWSTPYEVNNKFMPERVVISVSNDGKEFTQLAEIKHEVVRDDAVTFKNFGWEGEASARYIRYQALASDKFGGVLFTDEIVVK